MRVRKELRPELRPLFTSRGGYLKEVHQAETLERAVFKQHVSIYHGRVRHRVREALQLISLFRRHGVVIREKNFADTSERKCLLEGLPAQRTLRDDVRLLWSSYDLACKHEERAAPAGRAVQAGGSHRSLRGVAGNRLGARRDAVRDLGHALALQQ